MSREAFNAKAARGKRPCPVWVDAFQRDTQHLEADEVGAYFLILMAMWTRESCDFPDDDSRLARVSRVSVRLWKSRVGPVIRAFLTSQDGAVISQRLRKEAAFVEAEVQKQSDRKRGTCAKPQGDNNPDGQSVEKSDNPLESNDTHPSVDATPDEPGNYPSQQPNNPTVKNGGGGSAREGDLTLRERLLHAAGIDPSKIISPGPGAPGASLDMAEVGRWQRDLGFDDDGLVAAVAEIRAGMREVPNSLRYFTKPLLRIAAASAAPPLTPEALPAARHGASPAQSSNARIVEMASRQIAEEDARIAEIRARRNAS